MECSIIIVNFNTKNLTKQTIETINLNTFKLDYEIILVDNSTDINERISEDLYKVKKYFCENKGFGNACNLGSSKAIGKYLLFLNSDTIVHKDSINKCVDYIKSERNIGALGCKILLENGDLDHGCKRGFPDPQNSFYYFIGLDKLFPSIKRFGAYKLSYLDPNQIHKVDSVSGAFLLMKKDLFEYIGGFDEDYFMYGEDIDLCFRIKQLGYDIVYYSNTTITHLKGQSGLRRSSTKTIYHFYDSMLIFYRKHYLRNYNFSIYIAVYLFVKLKYYITILGKKIYD